MRALVDESGLELVAQVAGNCRDRPFKSDGPLLLDVLHEVFKGVDASEVAAAALPSDDDDQQQQQQQGAAAGGGKGAASAQQAGGARARVRFVWFGGLRESASWIWMLPSLLFCSLPIQSSPLSKKKT